MQHICTFHTVHQPKCRYSPEGLSSLFLYFSSKTLQYPEVIPIYHKLKSEPLGNSTAANSFLCKFPPNSENINKLIQKILVFQHSTFNTEQG